MKIIIMAVSFIFFTSSIAHVKDYTMRDAIDVLEKDADKEDTTKLIARGIEAANYYQLSLNNKKWYCPPKNIDLTNRQYINIIKKYLDKNTKANETDSSLYAETLLLALIDAFPCK